MIDTSIIEKINNIKAFKTKEFGPSYWYVLFTMVLGGSFPHKVNLNDKNHKKIVKYYKNTFIGLMYTLPCSLCRESYKSFLKINNIDKYLTSKYKLVYWLYLMRDLVNKKLISQEKDLISQGIKPLCITPSSPSFETVINQYYKKKANKCSIKCKKCL